ncbi:ubiquitin carboxyl-terminal hydrolase 22 [Caerostris darwini]|uniref:Ubiquitin carboxyl-terminal hydrolase 22 n=1 Tax=Caerostris darwini TaxID=1538125 RepID=A0AAV4UU88_9ARAC|nr:ubiquitin carboxyl-terminal hydrolase 22 [Caerostris darwini]
MNKYVNPSQEDKDISSDHESLVTKYNTLDLNEGNLTVTKDKEAWEDERNNEDMEDVQEETLEDERSNAMELSVDAENMSWENADEKDGESASSSKEDIIIIINDALKNVELNVREHLKRNDEILTHYIDNEKEVPNCECIHFEDVEILLRNYTVILSFYVTHLAYKEEAVCKICKHANNRIFACLTCPFFGCYEAGHMKKHVLEAKHCLAVSIHLGEIFCFECEDFVYHETFENQLHKCQVAQSMVRNISPRPTWKPNRREIPLLKAVGMKQLASDTLLGVRGIQNVGNTCYINCILQVLLHNPILVEYFLLDKRNCFKNKNCVSYELYNLFQRTCRGASSALRPTDFLRAYQKASGHVVGVYQQDAGEFFHNLVTILNDCCGEKNERHADWNRFLEKTFYGSYLNIRICTECNYTSRTMESFIEVVMGIKAILKVERNNEKFIHLISGLKEKFCSEQKLTDKCPNCEKKGTISLFEKIYELPSIVCFNVPRAFWSKKREILEKDPSHLYFPEVIDLSPYVHPKIRQAQKDPDFYKYVLFGAVQHQGGKTGGHYWSYVRHRDNRWLSCEDEIIKDVSLRQVLSCEASLLFYYKRFWNY